MQRKEAPANITELDAKIAEKVHNFGRKMNKINQYKSKNKHLETFHKRPQ